MPPDNPGPWDNPNLPGLDDPEYAASHNQPAPSDPPAPPAPQQPEPPEYEWSDDQLDEWFQHEFDGETGLDLSDQTMYGIDGSDDPEFLEAADALLGLSDPNDNLMSLLFATPGWTHLTLEMKVKFRRGWERKYPPPKKVESDPEKTSPAPGIYRSIMIWLGAAALIVVVAVTIIAIGSSDGEPPVTEQKTDEHVAALPSTEAPPTTAESVGTAPPSTAATPATPPDGYGYCDKHPEQNADNCRLYYIIGGSDASLLRVPDFPFVLTATHTFQGPIPTNPDLPIEYHLLIESTNGQRIEQILSGGPGEPLTCTRLENGVEVPTPEEQICGEVSSPNAIRNSINIDSLSPGTVSWTMSTLETEADGTKRGDVATGGGDDNSVLTN